MESGSPPAAIRLAAASRGFPGTGPTRLRIQCTHPGHLTYCAATASTTSLHPDSAAAPSTIAAPGLTVLQAVSLTVLVSVVSILSCVSVSLHCVITLEVSSHLLVHGVVSARDFEL